MSAPNENSVPAPAAKPEPNIPRLTTAKAIMKETGVPRSTFYRVAAEGRGPTPIKIGSRIYFYQSDVVAWLESLRSAARDQENIN